MSRKIKKLLNWRLSQTPRWGSKTTTIFPSLIALTKQMYIFIFFGLMNGTGCWKHSASYWTQSMSQSLSIGWPSLNSIAMGMNPFGCKWQLVHKLSRVQLQSLEVQGGLGAIAKFIFLVEYVVPSMILWWETVVVSQLWTSLKIPFQSKTSPNKYWSARWDPKSTI